jgi:hypothetical protein
VCVALHSLPLSTGCRVSSQNTCGSQCTCVPFSNRTYVHRYHGTYNVMSQLSDCKRAHMCIENHVCTYQFGTMVRAYVPMVLTYVRTHVYHMVIVLEIPNVHIPWCVRTYVHMYVPWYHGTGAVARAGPHACEDCGGDPRCRHRCRVGTVVYCDVFMLRTPTSFPVAPECLYFKSFLR